MLETILGRKRGFRHSILPCRQGVGGMDKSIPERYEDMISMISDMFEV